MRVCSSLAAICFAGAWSAEAKKAKDFKMLGMNTCRELGESISGSFGPTCRELGETVLGSIGPAWSVGNIRIDLGRCFLVGVVNDEVGKDSLGTEII